MALFCGGAYAASTVIPQPQMSVPPNLSRGFVSNLTAVPVVTGFHPATCIAKGGTVTVLGKNFATADGKGVALGGHGIHVDTQVLSWGATAIKVRIPNDTKIQVNQWYYLGVEQANHAKWLSNISKTITICPNPVVTPPKLSLPSSTVGSGAFVPPSGALPPGSAPSQPPQPQPQPSQPPQGSENAAGGDTGYEYPDTGTALPQPSAGTLLTAPLPPVPQVPPIAPEAEKSDVEPSEVVVIHTDPEQAKQFAATLQGMGLTIKRRRTLKGLGLVVSVVRLPAGMRVRDALQQLRGQLPDLWADANHRYTLQAGTDAKSYGRRLTGWDARAGACPTAPRIGIVDTGVADHPALRGAHLTEKSFLPAGRKAAPAQHGTAVAALLAGRGDGDIPSGLLPEAQLYVAAVFRSRADGGQETSAEQIAYALNWLLEQRVSTINLSLGGPRNLLLEASLHRVLEAGVAVAAAAGNGGPNGKPVYPAAQDGVVAVTAVDANAHLYAHATRAGYVAFSAPGVDVWSANAGGGGAYFSGTSYAVPFVAAALAMRASHGSVRARIAALSAAAVDLGSPGRDPEFGWGLIHTDGRCATAP